METVPVQAGQIQTRLASFAPTTYDAANRSVECTFSTGARRKTWFGFEELEVSPAAVDLSRVALGQVRAIDSHDQFTTDAITGSVMDAQIVNGALIGRMTFADNAKGREIEGLVASGHLRGVSIGYTIEAIEKVGVENDSDIWRATRWTLMEVSWVSVPADASAGVRSAGQSPGFQSEHTTMTTGAPAAAAPAASPANRADINRQIRSQATAYGVPGDFANDLIDREVTAENAATAILAEAARRQADQTGGIAAMAAGRANDNASPAQRAEAMGEALFARRHAGHVLSDAARPFAYMPVVEMARASLYNAGVAAGGMAPVEVIERSIGMHTTSDLPAALASFARREAVLQYQIADSGLRQVSIQTTAQDFRTKSKVSLDTDARLEPLSEGGEIKQGKLVDGVETYALDTFAKSIAISRQALINDDLNALGDLAGLLGQESAAFEATFLVKLLEGSTGLGPKMSDGQFLFHSTHKNVAASGATISETSISAGRLAMRRQTKPGGSIMGTAPKFLVVPAELETTGEKFLAAVNAATTAETNTFAGKMTLVVEPRLTSATRWYLVGDPAQAPGMEYAYLAGAPGPQIKTFEPSNQDGLLTRVILDFGGGFTDFRGWYANGGA